MATTLQLPSDTEIEERSVERLDLRDREVEVGLRLPQAVLDLRPLEHLDPGVVALLHLAPQLVGLREEVVGVDREDACLRLEREEELEEHGLLLLEGARERDLARERLEQRGEDLLRAERLPVALRQGRAQAAPP